MCIYLREKHPPAWQRTERRKSITTEVLLSTVATAHAYYTFPSFQKKKKSKKIYDESRLRNWPGWKQSEKLTRMKADRETDPDESRLRNWPEKLKDTVRQAFRIRALWWQDVTINLYQLCLTQHLCGTREASARKQGRFIHQNSKHADDQHLRRDNVVFYCSSSHDMDLYWPRNKVSGIKAGMMMMG